MLCANSNTIYINRIMKLTNCPQVEKWMGKYAMHTHPTYTHKYLYKNITAHKTQRVREKHTEIKT